MINDVLHGGHGKVVLDLLRRVEDVRREKYEGPNILLLRGASGVGKSRIIRELYAALCVGGDENVPRYWSPFADSGRPLGGDPMPSRKELGPERAIFVDAGFLLAPISSTTPGRRSG